jgi:hypothetical protein
MSAPVSIFEVDPKNVTAHTTLLIPGTERKLRFLSWEDGYHDVAIIDPLGREYSIESQLCRRFAGRPFGAELLRDVGEFVRAWRPPEQTPSPGT